MALVIGLLHMAVSCSGPLRGGCSEEFNGRPAPDLRIDDIMAAVAL